MGKGLSRGNLRSDQRIAISRDRPHQRGQLHTESWRDFFQTPGRKSQFTGLAIHPKLDIFLAGRPDETYNSAPAADVVCYFSLSRILQRAARPPIFHKSLERILRARFLIRAAPKRIGAFVVLFPEKIEKLFSAPVLTEIAKSEV